MAVRGAPAIGAAAGFAMAQAFGEAPRADPWRYVRGARLRIEATRPTARDLFFATECVWNAAKSAANPNTPRAPLSRQPKSWPTIAWPPAGAWVRWDGR